MKFYFCEACGKRITDVDIELGEGKNKKLKGVYCKNCAVGVMTMETLPLTDDQAKDILGQPNPIPHSSSMPATRKGSPRRASSAIRLPSAEPAGKRTLQRDPPRSMGPGNGLGTWAMPLGLAAAALIILVVILAFGSGKRSASGGKSESRADQTSRKRSSSVKEGIKFQPEQQGNLDKNQESSGTREGLAQSGSKTNQIDDRNGDPRSSETKVFAGPDAAAPEKSLKVSVAPSKSEVPGPSKVPDGAKPETDKLEGDMPRTTAEENSASAKRESPQPDRSAFERHFDAMLALIQEASCEAAAEKGRQMALDKELGDWQAYMAELPQSLEVLVSAQKARLRSAKKMEGKTTSLETIHGLQKGFVKQVDDKNITLQARFRINGAWKEGNVSTVRLADLSARAWKRIHSEKEPTQPTEWVARFLSQLAMDAFDEAGNALARFAAHPLYAPMKHALERKLKQRREQRARDAWAAIRRRDVEGISETEARVVLGQLDAFESKFDSTAWLVESASQRKALREKMVVIAMAFEKNLTRLLHGAVTVEDAKRMRVSLDYDFKSDAQVRDWSSQKPGAWEEKGQIKRSPDGSIYLRPGGGSLNCLAMDAFDLVDFRLKMDFRIKSFGNYGCLLLQVGRSGGSGESGTVTIRVQPNWGKKVSSGYLQFQMGQGKGPALKGKKVPHSIPEKGQIEIVVKAGRIKVVLADGFAIEKELPRAPFYPHIGIGGGTHIMFNVDRIQVTGNLDRTWFKKAADEQSR